MSKSISVRLAVATAIAAIAGSCSAGDTPAPDVAHSTDVASGSGDAVVGEVAGETITLSQLDDWIRGDLFRQQADTPKKLYELRSAAIDRMIDEKIVEITARQRSVEPQVLIESEVAVIGPVGDEEIAAFYEENKARLQRRGDLETLKPQIREFLEGERPNRVMAKLRESATVRVDLEPPRIMVASSGPSRGPVDAPITIVEFSDYECPFCGRAEPILEEVLNRYPGKVRLVYRHLPLTFHKNARPAAAASICAEDQDKFWEYHALLFTNQRQLGSEQLMAYATQIELDVDAFNACMAAETTDARIDADLAEARDAGASGTPAFFINGIPLSGALPVEEFAKVIDAELARLEADGGPTS